MMGGHGVRNYKAGLNGRSRRLGALDCKPGQGIGETSPGYSRNPWVLPESQGWYAVKPWRGIGTTNVSHKRLLFVAAGFGGA